MYVNATFTFYKKFKSNSICNNFNFKNCLKVFCGKILSNVWSFFVEVGTLQLVHLDTRIHDKLQSSFSIIFHFLPNPVSHNPLNVNPGRILP